MSILVSLLGYIFLFFGICVLVVMLISFANIITKSYNPKHAIVIISFLLLLFFTNTLFVYLNFGKVTSGLNTLLQSPASGGSSSSKSTSVNF
jgi:hypothetical protein